MARPPAISMHRARGASVPSRRRIRRPGSARRAAAGLTLSPRLPARRRPLCSGPAPPGCPQARRPPDGRALQVRARVARPPGGPGMQVNLEKVAGRAGRPSAAGRRRPGPARFRFRLGQRSLTALVADAVTGSRGPLFTAGRRSNTAKPEPEGEPQRASGPRKWALGRALRRCPPGAVPPRQELREPVPLCSPPLRRGKQGSVWNPGLRAAAAGLCSAAALAQRRPRSGAVPGRARLLTCAPQVRIEFKATPEDGLASVALAGTVRGAWTVRVWQARRTCSRAQRFLEEEKVS
ncbi:uncharacterized protein LOC105867292 isoform X2 [Microcebus murinus]|uniref:uncharacterized protein LOC105867292 isoform X2 n=1 Tax=Microcebus murinus TaxID=30608 RepID=UPI003F6D896A